MTATSDLERTARLFRMAADQLETAAAAKRKYVESIAMHDAPENERRASLAAVACDAGAAELRLRAATILSAAASGEGGAA